MMEKWFLTFIIIHYYGKIKVGVKGCPALERYFTEIGISASSARYEPTLVAKGMKLGGGLKVNTYYIENGKWNLTIS